jgi:hypothetical protein
VGCGHVSLLFNLDTSTNGRGKIAECGPPRRPGSHRTAQLVPKEWEALSGPRGVHPLVHRVPARAGTAIIFTGACEGRAARVRVFSVEVCPWGQLARRLLSAACADTGPAARTRACSTDAPCWSTQRRSSTPRCPGPPRRAGPRSSSSTAARWFSQGWFDWRDLAQRSVLTESPLYYPKLHSARELGRPCPFLSSSASSVLLLCRGLHRELYERPFNSVLSSESDKRLLFGRMSGTAAASSPRRTARGGRSHGRPVHRQLHAPLSRGTVQHPPLGVERGIAGPPPASRWKGGAAARARRILAPPSPGRYC